MKLVRFVVEYNPQFLRDLAEGEAPMSELSHVPMNLVGAGDNVIECASGLVDPFGHVELARQHRAFSRKPDGGSAVFGRWVRTETSGVSSPFHDAWG